MEWLLNETRHGLRSSLLASDPAGLTEEIQDTAIGQVAYLMDMAKANVLELLCETTKAIELVDCHICPTSL